jgi:putative transcriptional regulator
MRFELLKQRKIAKMTQQQMATAIGIERQAYMRMESGKATIPVELAIKIANLFNRKVEDIFLPEEVNEIHANENAASLDQAV